MDVPNFNTPLSVLKFARVDLTHYVCQKKCVVSGVFNKKVHEGINE